MRADEIQRVAVIGAGVMGPGIALEFARFGYEVSLHDISEKALRDAMALIQEDLDLMADMEFITRENAKAAYSKLRTELSLEDAVSGADYVIEAISEKLTLKQELFSRLDELCPPPAILASNSSGLIVTHMAARTKHPERILVTHYFSPPHCIPLVEVFGGDKTDPQIIETVAQLLRLLQKKVVIVENEQFRQIGNLLQGALSKEIHRLVDLGASPYMIDDVITYGFGRRLPFQGYFKRMDVVGLDGRMERYIAYGREPWKPIAERIKRGELGVKTGKGFYEWPDDSAKKEYRRLNRELIRFMKLDRDADCMNK
jgi:3-hydroxybutyryl-CoA dehydrogenase